MDTYTTSAKSRKSSARPEIRLDVAAADQLRSTFPRSIGPTNRLFVEQVESLLELGALPIAELLLEATERGCSVGWLESRLRQYASIDAAQLRTLVGAGYGGRP